ncbi:MAG TPA: type II secretion system F family protein [Acidimicrobiales bacterium]|nr:type II secretion system F family protein [Acidimicrobiales bacterium]
MTTDFVLLGLCIGIGLVFAVVGLMPRLPRLADEIGRYGRPAPEGRARGLSALATFGTSIERLVAGDERVGRLSRDLAITDRTRDRHFAASTVAALAGLTAPIVLGGALAAMGWHLPALGVLTCGGLGGLGGLAATTLELHRSAARARERFRRELSCWLELVALAQAGGMGVESALEAAGRISADPGFARISQALERARHSGATAWEELGRLGSEIGIDDLNELAASLGLAGSEGARIRTSLRAKSASLRRRQMSEAQSRANSTTERLFLPSIVLMIGFLVFLMFPAGVSLTHVI